MVVMSVLMKVALLAVLKVLLMVCKTVEAKVASKAGPSVELKVLMGSK